MPYCVYEDVVGQSQALAEDASASSRVAQGIAVAQSIVDGRLKNKFSLPFPDPVPKLIWTVAVNLAAGWTLKASFSGNAESTQYKTGLQFYRDGMELLNGIAEGTMALEDSVSAVVLPSQRAPIVVGQPRELEVDILGRWGPRSPFGRFPHH